MQRDLIYDVGFHHGEDTEFYLTKGFKVVAIEAHPALYHAGRQKFIHDIESGRLMLLNVAVAETSGPISFFESDNDVWGSIRRDAAKRNERLGAGWREITVEGRQFGEILRQFGVPYYMKVDIEGADLLCLKALAEFDDRSQYISIEAEVDVLSGIRKEIAALSSLGYAKFKIVRQGHVPLQSCPNPAREGRFVEYKFPYGSSGMFGEEAPGEWISGDRAVEGYRKIVRVQRLFGDKGWIRRLPLGNKITNLLQPDVSWYDTHASLT
ncbi:MAG: FkbM family methyltransferase [Candidatus Binatus sp.]